MKVTKEGTLTRKTTCKTCTSELEYEPEDVQRMSFEDSPMRFYIKCPMCVKRVGPNFGIIYVSAPDSPAPKN